MTLAACASAHELVVECFEHTVKANPNYAKAWRQLPAAREQNGEVSGAIAA